MAHVNAVGTADTRYADTILAFESGVVGQLTASRISQDTEWQLTLSAAECRVKAYFLNQTIRIHR